MSDTINSSNPNQEDYDLIRKAKDGDIKSRNVLIQNNVKLVSHIAKNYLNRGVDFNDLFQEGSIGIIRAIENFDFSKNVKFSTHAYYHISRSIQTAISNLSSTIKKPDAKYVLMMRINRIKPLLEAELGHTPSIAEIAEALESQHKEYKNKLESDDIEEAISIFQPVASINFKMDDEGNEMSEVLVVEDDNEKEKETFLFEDEFADFWSSVDTVLAKLSAEEKYVIKCIYGIDEKEKTSKSLATELKKSERDIKIIEQSALIKIRDTKILNNYYFELLNEHVERKCAIF